MTEAIKAAYPDCKMVEMPRIGRPSSFKDIDVVWVNWYETLSNYSTPSFIKDLTTKLLTLAIIKICRIKLVMTFHNRQPHEMRFPTLNRLFFRLLLRLSDRIVILSEASREAIKEISNSDYSAKIFKVNHPSYVCNEKIYGPKSSDSMSVFFFGIIRPYKNIELIIEAAHRHPGTKFTIAGNPGNNIEYSKRLKEMTNGMSNIDIHFGYLTDEKVNDFLERNDVLLLPYSLKSSLNSGVAYYAFSKGINLIIPKIGSVLELNEPDNVFCYEYSNETEHLAKIDAMLSKAESEFANDYEGFVNRPKATRQQIIKENSIEALALQIRKMDL